MPSDFDKARNSGGVPPSSAPHASASEPDNSGGPSPSAAPHASAADADAPPKAPGPFGEPEDHEAKLEHDLEELTAKAQKADEYLELAQRTKADFENYRKRAAREIAAAQERGVVKLCRELLPAVDSLDRALAAADSEANGGDHDLASGIKLVHAEVLAALARVGVEPFSPEGERFDPEHHEAVAQLPVDGAESGTVVEVYQRGYRLGDAVIRPAKVVVAG
jgi:molecular chaperone GrpE